MAFKRPLDVYRKPLQTYKSATGVRVYGGQDPDEEDLLQPIRGVSHWSEVNAEGTAAPTQREPIREVATSDQNDPNAVIIKSSWYYDVILSVKSGCCIHTKMMRCRITGQVYAKNYAYETYKLPFGYSERSVRLLAELAIENCVWCEVDINKPRNFLCKKCFELTIYEDRNSCDCSHDPYLMHICMNCKSLVSTLHPSKDIVTDGETGILICNRCRLSKGMEPRV